MERTTWKVNKLEEQEYSNQNNNNLKAVDSKTTGITLQTYYLIMLMIIQKQSEACSLNIRELVKIEGTQSCRLAQLAPQILYTL